MRLPEAQRRQRESIENWAVGTKPLVRSESRCFLEADNPGDYVALGADDSDKAGLEHLLDGALRMLPSIARRVG